MVRSESLVGLPWGPSASQKHWQSFEVQIVFADPFVGFAGAPGAKHKVSADKREIVQAIGKRLSTETKMMMSTTALMRGKPFLAITRRSSASADPR